MGSFLETMKRYALLRTVFYLVLGIAMLAFPEAVITFIIYIFAAYCVLMGIINIVASRREGGGTGGLVSGILLLVLGVCLFLFSRAFASILPIVLGILLFILGITQIVQAFGAKQYTGKVNVLGLILGVLVLIGGLLGVVDPFGSLVLLFRLFGVVLLILAINEFSLYLSLRKGTKPAP
ncbi:DUF308 domain-containing protein [Ruminococcaceae bacterium OttesenSCG-928-I18]|nr:DUF308 domain-containing protein [Ruminococcaceae bacterium OttesenSCG-928-I18]